MTVVAERFAIAQTIRAARRNRCLVVELCCAHGQLLAASLTSITRITERRSLDLIRESHVRTPFNVQVREREYPRSYQKHKDNLKCIAAIGTTA